ncbi:MAG: glycoside hydrolase family 26 protein [Thermoflavifilum sp.]|nr:glycoside hydrolase family 26 protein [Thermoflavifilum sp.]
MARWLYILLCALCVNVNNTFAQIDAHASPATHQLYTHLLQLYQRGKILFGHQESLEYGVGWQYRPNYSDVYAVTGDYPALLGCDLSGIELGDSMNIDHVPFWIIRHDVIQQYQAGGVVTFSWHMHNPVNGSSAWDTTAGNVVASILPGGKAHQIYVQYLQQAASFLNSLETASGEKIPIILRLFHELNGNWFWWGRSHCSAQEMKSLFAFTIAYLRDSLNLHHVLYAYNTDRFPSATAYLERYPGDKWIDILGFDIYQAYDISSNQAFSQVLSRMCGILDSISNVHHKLAALTEFGYNQLPDSSWWMQVLWPAIAPYHLSYILAWRNAGYQEFYVPYPGQASATSFKQFALLDRILLRSKLASIQLYQ